MQQKQTKLKMLIAGDSSTLLCEMLSDKFDVYKAIDKTDALEQLKVHTDIAVALLDIKVLDLDGNSVLETIINDNKLSKIPIAVISAGGDEENQVKALSHGAVDVITKPYIPEIIINRINNIIKNQEIYKQNAKNHMLEKLIYPSDIDESVGVFNKYAFCRLTEELLRKNPGKKYVILRWDIDRFKVFNDMFGVKAGDEYLVKVGRLYSKKFHNVVYGHWVADHFVCCMEEKDYNEKKMVRELSQLVSSTHDDFEFVVRLGAYIVDDPSLNVNLMCDRALLALKSIKGSYETRAAYYNDAMRSSLIEEQEIISDMEAALEGGQFELYIQPQYNYAEQKLHGAEVLVRWNHPKKGMIFPNSFIPIFERNGYISRLDEYVWEHACMLLRDWINRGVKYTPLSVNVSRRDIYNPHLCNTIKNILDKYSLDPSLLRLEITESAYMDNPEQLIRVVEKLHSYGFTVEMDDFGTGYSSLNTLKEVPVDMLKLDMKFIQSSMDNDRSGSILTSVIRMAHWIKLLVIAEGVETKEQADYLKSVGCIYMQGYYYAKPMPVDDFEKLLKDSNIENSSIRLFCDDTDSAQGFLSASTQATLLFNSFVGGAAIIEYDGCNIEAIRMNDKFFDVLGTTRESYKENQLHILDRFSQKYKDEFISAVNKAITSRAESSCELCGKPFDEKNKYVWTRVRMRLLARNIDRYILYLSVENITHLMEVLNQNTQLSQQLTGIVDSVPGGILDFKLTDHIETIYFNDMAASMFGYSSEEYGQRFMKQPLKTIHPDDLPGIMTYVERILLGEKNILETSYRHICKDGNWKWVRFTGKIVRQDRKCSYASGIMIDIDTQVKRDREAEMQAFQFEKQSMFMKWLYNTIPCGIMQFSAKCGRYGFRELHGINDAAWSIFGYTSKQQYMEAIRGRSRFKDVHPDDSYYVQQCVERVCDSECNSREECEFRIIRPNGCMRWIQGIFQKVCFTDGEQVLQVVVTDITDQKHEDLKGLISAMYSAYDEVYEFDIKENTTTLRASNTKGPSYIGVTISFASQIKHMAEDVVVPKDKDKFFNFFMHEMKGIKKIPQSLEYCYINHNNQERWACATVLHIDGPVYLSCTRDITDQKNAQKLAHENKMLQILVNERHAEDERNRIIIDSTGMLIYDYDPVTDILRGRHKGHSGRVIIEETKEYLENIFENPSISVLDRQRLYDCFSEAKKAPMRKTIEYRGNRFGNGFCLCRMQIASIGDEKGRVYRIIGQISKVENEHQERLLSEKLRKITGVDYNNVPFQHEITEDVLRALEDADNPDVAVQTVLEVVGKQMDVGRVYIIQENSDGVHYDNTFEWCNQGIAPEIDNLQNYVFPDGMKQMYIDLFKDKGVFVCEDVGVLPKWIRSTLEPQGIKSIIQCAIINDDKFKGFVGFDECLEKRAWSDVEICTLRVISQVLGAFLYMRMNGGSRKRLQKALCLMDESPAYAYIINPDTYEILYCNKSAKDKGAALNAMCYKTFMGRGCACKSCPVKRLKDTGMSVPEHIIENDRHNIMQAQWIMWEGNKAILISGTDTTCFEAEPMISRQAVYKRDIKKYTSTLFALYDEILEMDFFHDTYIILASKKAKLTSVSRRRGLKKAIEGWMQSHSPEAKALLKEFFSIDNIIKKFHKGIIPMVEYEISIPDEPNKWCASTLLQIDDGRYLCCNKDITQEKEASLLEKKVTMLQSQAEIWDCYRLAIEHKGVAVIEMDNTTGEFVSTASYSRYEVSRYKNERMLSSNSGRSLVHPDDVAILDELIEERNKGAIYREATLRVKMTDGSYRWTHIVATYIHDSMGKLIKTIATFEDVDEDIRTKLQLKEVKERLSMVIDNIPTGVAIFEMRDKMYPIFASDKACEMFGFSREEYDLLIANCNPVTFLPDINDLQLGESRSVENNEHQVINKLHVQRKDGSWFWLRIFYKVDSKRAGYPLYYAVLADVTKEVEG